MKMDSKGSGSTSNYMGFSNVQIALEIYLTERLWKFQFGGGDTHLFQYKLSSYSVRIPLVPLRALHYSIVCNHWFGFWFLLGLPCGKRLTIRVVSKMGQSLATDWNQPRMCVWFHGISNLLFKWSPIVELVECWSKVVSKTSQSLALVKPPIRISHVCKKIVLSHSTLATSRLFFFFGIDSWFCNKIGFFFYWYMRYHTRQLGVPKRGLRKQFTKGTTRHSHLWVGPPPTLPRWRRHSKTTSPIDSWLIHPKHINVD